MERELDISAVGVPVRVELEASVSDAAVEELRRQWRHALVGESVPARVGLRFGLRGASGEDSEEARSPDRRRLVSSEAELGSRVATDVTLAALEAQAGRRFLFHACAVALDDGRVIGFVGRSGMGKTTLAQHLGQRFGYVTDETLSVDHHGSVSVYQKPLSIGHAPHPKSQHAAGELGMRIAPVEGLKLAALVLLDRRDEPIEPIVKEMPLVEAVPAIAAHMSYFARMPGRVREISELAIATGGIRRLTYSDAASVTDVIPRILSARSPRSPLLAGFDAPRASGAGSGYRRVDHVEALDVDGDLLVLHGSTITRLNELAAVVWRMAVERNLDDLVAAVVNTLGPSPAGVDARTVIERNIDELIAAGLLLADDQEA